MLRTYWWLALGVLLVVVGLTQAVASHAWGQATIGWFAYSPLSDAAPQPVKLLVGDVRQFWIGLAVAVVGLLVTAGGAGYRFGMRIGSARGVSGPPVD